MCEVDIIYGTSSPLFPLLFVYLLPHLLSLITITHYNTYVLIIGYAY